ncbi:hypothetical protein ACFC3F_01345 [Microbacterium sp. NPDC055910]|uniref:hypothetical protein n=1 Tax=Microbacterium sp. NPDC055910 TaxID=3345659 RepID=UPI0035E33897
MSGFLQEWSEFNVAMTGATAALAGLVIVAASVNIGDIVASRPLTARLGSAIVMLVVALIASALGLVPGIDGLWFGGLVVAAALIALGFQIATARVLAADRDPRDGARWAKSLLGFVPAVAYLAAGVLALAAQPAALAVAAAGALLAIVGAILVSWVALVEVLR